MDIVDQVYSRLIVPLGALDLGAYVIGRSVMSGFFVRLSHVFVVCGFRGAFFQDVDGEDVVFWF